MTRDVEALAPPYRRFYEELLQTIPRDRLIIDPLRLFAYGTDASFYRLIPKVVVKARTWEEVVQVLRHAAEQNLPVTFRAAGTSLSGQAISDSILVVLTGGWRKTSLWDQGARISLEPGVIGAEANLALARFGRKIGPDPASIQSCMIGGIAANNASGMCCGTAENSYQTVEAMKLVFADGATLDTADPASREIFSRTHRKLLEGLLSLRREILADGELSSRIREKYRIKNTTGYSLNSFVDFENPFDILLHLMVGSEGTLAFIAEVTYRTVPEHPFKASALAFFQDIGAACRATIALKTAPVAAVELMDRASLRSVENKAGMPESLKSLGPEAAALLIEVRGESPVQLAARLKEVEGLVPGRFTSERDQCEKLWDIRRGLFPAVGAAREIGTTVVIEDVAFPLGRMAEGARDLQAVMKKHGYDGIIFGHALDGNFHFVFTQGFGTAQDVSRYENLMNDVCELVVGKYDGSLKGEHGTGRNMAPFVEREWGKSAHELMKRLKSLFDPKGILNPGVILNANARAHLENLKELPRTHELIDRCIECGFCEVKCPSRDLTLTPRQRIAVQRELARLRALPASREPAREKRLNDDYRYLGEETCAVDGLCATACPVEIDTGAYTKWLRSRNQSGLVKLVASGAASHFGGLLQVARLGLNTLEAIPGREWRARIPGPAQIERFQDILHGPDRAGEVLYFPSCLSRTLGPSKGDLDQRALTEAMISILKKARFDVRFPSASASMEGLCCGLPFESKGFPEQADSKLRELEASLLKHSDGGRIPILCDTSPCAHRMLKRLDSRLRIHEGVEFIHEFLLDHLAFAPIEGPLMLHVTCSSTKMGLAGKIREVAEACSRKVVVPSQIGCCGFAGDRGFSHPELNRSALAVLKGLVPEGCESGVSNSRTCEIGLSVHSGVPYQSLIYLVDRCTRVRGAVPV